MLRQLFKDSAIYTVAALLTTGLSFVLVPIFARVLSPAEYGLFDYVTVIGLLVGVTIALEVAQGLMFYLAREKDAEAQSELISTAFWVHVATYGGFCVIVTVFAAPIATVVLGSEDQQWLVIVSALQYFAVALVRLWTIVERSLLRPWRVLAISVTSAAAAGGLAVLGAMSWGVTGLMAGQMAGQGSVAVVLVGLYRSRVFRRFTREAGQRLLTFSAPLVLSSVAFLLTTYIDRLLVKHLLGLEALGYYSLGARVASGVTLLLLGFQSALGPLIYSSLDRRGIHEDVARIFRLFVFAASGCLLALILLAGPIVEIVGGAQYAPAAPVLRLLAAAALIQGSYIFFPGLYVAGRTWILAVIHGVGVGLNVGLNLLLISRWELVGAGVATLIGAIVIFSLNAAFAQRHFPVPVFRRTRALQKNGSSSNA